MKSIFQHIVLITFIHIFSKNNNQVYDRIKVFVYVCSIKI